LAQDRAPEGASPRFALAIIDVETTGLDPDVHEMIDLGAIYVDLEGRELGRFFIRIAPEHPERITPGARAVNGYDPLRWQALGAAEPSQAVAAFQAFHAHAAQGRTLIFTAFNVAFDQAFLTRLLAREGGSFRDLFFYHTLDLPSMAWGLGVTNPTSSALAAALGIPEETRDPLLHTGETGAAFNLSLYRALLDLRAERSER
jgi:DNA polymerase III epsilon subunit-like protein